jgi:hypothetical protein
MTKKAEKEKKPTKIELKKQAIAACKDARGRVTTAAVIEAARDSSSVLHAEFEWDLEKAAYQSWTETARRLIREVQLIVDYQDVRVVAPYYVSDQSKDEPAYVETSKIARKHAFAQRALSDELARIKGAVNRGMALSAAFGLVSNFERMLDAVIETERLFSSHADEEESERVSA